MKKIVARAVLLLILTPAVWQTTSGQETGTTQDKQPEKIIISSNADYNKAGKIKRLLLGEHYRKEWAMEAAIPVLNVDSFAGGLFPIKMGGGMQTKSLRLASAAGKQYVLRSVNKDPSKAIPEIYAGTFANDIIQDQISSSNPYAPLAVAALAEAAGIYHTHPAIVYVQEAVNLDSFNTGFANTLCLFEERPVGDQQDNAALDHAWKVVNSEKMYQQVFGNSRHRIDEKAFLTARLFDMWIGDWDRHEDQWIWAAFKEDDKTIYRPIPRDRDQAFAKLDGLIPQIAALPWMLRKTQNFNYRIRDINGLNMAGSPLDRNFTTQLTLQDWLTITGELQAKLTDAEIEAAFMMMPENIFTISGKQIIAKLKKRRDDLKEYATTYYYFLAKEVNIVGTNKNEYIEITRDGHDSTTVALYNPDNGTTGAFYQQTFANKHTKEIRIYGLGGNDKFVLNGNSSNGPVVRIIGGNGEDSIIDRSAVKGLAHKTKIYDSAAYTLNAGGEARTHFSTDTLKNNYNRLERRYNWLAPKFSPGYNADDGIYLGGGFTFKKRQFGKTPYGYIQSAWANYAFATGAYNFAYNGTFIEAIGKWDLNISTEINAPNYVLNYFGAGNETRLLNTDRNYNRVRANQEIISPSVSRYLGDYHYVTAGIEYQSVKIEKNETRFIGDAHALLDSAIFSRKHFASLHTGYQFNSTDNWLYPTRGMVYNGDIEYVQNLRDGDGHFVKFSADASLYLSTGALTAALRIGGATNAGDGYKFFQANTLGGDDNLRGYRKSRFAGKTSVYQNTELRLKIKTARGYYLRGNAGILAFVDNGRVWIPNEKSGTWHCGYGGGIWFLPYNMVALTATYAMSAESNLFSIKAGFLF